mgnify:CR=1 FL=1
MIPFKKLDYNLDNVWVTSDTHYSHKNIVKGISTWNSGYRDFQTLQEHDDCIVNNINKYVKKDDLLIHLGDWSFGGKDKIKEFLDRINCKNIILIQGNHDHHINNNIEGFLEFNQIGFYKIEDFCFVMCHYPMLEWYGKFKESIHLFGHVHNQLKTNNNSLDVGIDSAFEKLGEYRPFSIKEVINYLKLYNNLI